MDKTEVHEMLTKLPDDQKMKLAIQCQINNMTVAQVEEMLANIFTAVQQNITPAIREYQYLNGDIEHVRW